LPTNKPAKIGKYEVLDVLGRGGMGVVYRARDARLGRTVAVKMLTEGFAGAPDMLRRFYEEANRHAALQHNNIVIVFDAGDQDGEPYIVMEFVEGTGLDKILKEEQRLRPEVALSVVEQVCLALAYAHRKGVIHRDVKPANVIVQKNGTAKLLDFGIARDEIRVDQTITNTGTLVGTPPYMAPERFRGVPIDGRSDIFSAGVLLYQLITGRLPFDADYPAVIEQILRVEPPAPSQLVADCPAALDAIVAHALAKSPLDRYPDADDLAMDLHEVAEGITRAHISELMVEAEQHFNEREFHAARTALRQLLRLDSQNVAGKRLLSLVEQRLTQQERDRRVHELTRLAQQAAGERDWERALALCDEGLGLSPASATLIEVRKSVIEGKQTQERVSQLLQESANARKKGELSRAQSQAASAQRLDPLNTQIMALCKVLGQEIDEKRRREELRVFLEEVKEQLAARDFEEALVWLNKAEAIYPENAEVLRLKDQLAIALTEDRRKAIVRKLEEKAAVSGTIDKLRLVSADLANALKEFPNDPALLRLRLSLEPRTQVMEDEFFIREVSKSSAELPPEEGLARIREALRKVPGNEQLLNLESALSERVTRQTRERQLAQRLQEATQAIDNRLYLEAVKILERCQADGFSSYEIDGLLELAKSEASKRISQEVLERTHSQAKRLIELEDYENAVQLLRGALRQVDEPVLHRQLDEALQKQQATEQRADAALERVDHLIRIELFDEAVLLLKEQSGGVKKLERVEQARVRASNMQEADANFSIVLGRCYAQMGNAQGIEDLKKALKTVATADAPGLEETIKRLRRRCEEIYGERASAAIASVRKFLAEQDRQGAEEALRATTQWLELAPPQAQEELKLLQAQTAAAKKVLGFRRGSR
jgi:eukaryotic-like serine/threonine-protein kinase